MTLFLRLFSEKGVMSGVASPHVTDYLSRCELNQATIPAVSWALDNTESPKPNGMGIAASRRGYPVRCSHTFCKSEVKLVTNRFPSQSVEAAIRSRKPARSAASRDRSPARSTARSI